MKKKDVRSLVSKKSDELEKIVLDLKKELFNLRFQKASGKLTNTSRVRQVRRQVARVKTVLQEQKHKAVK